MNNRDMEILNLTIRTKNSENTVDLAEDLKIDIENINEAFCEQPAKFAWWATVSAQAKALVDKKKLEIEKQEEYLKKTLVGELDSEIRQELEMNGEKITESKITNSIHCHPRFKEEQRKLYDLKSEFLELQSNATVLEIAKDSMNQRKDSLISLGAQLRLETTNTELTIKKQQANKIISENRGKRL